MICGCSFITLFLLLAKKTHKCSSTKYLGKNRSFTFMFTWFQPHCFPQKRRIQPIPPSRKVSRKSDVGTAKNDARRGKPGFLWGPGGFFVGFNGLTVFFLGRVVEWWACHNERSWGEEKCLGIFSLISVSYDCTSANVFATVGRSPANY